MAPVRHQNPEPDTGQHACLLYGACMAPAWPRTAPMHPFPGSPETRTGCQCFSPRKWPGSVRRKIRSPTLRVRPSTRRATPLDTHLLRQGSARWKGPDHGSGRRRQNRQGRRTVAGDGRNPVPERKPMVAAPPGHRMGRPQAAGHLADLAHRLHEQGVHGGARGGRRLARTAARRRRRRRDTAGKGQEARRQKGGGQIPGTGEAHVLEISPGSMGVPEHPSEEEGIRKTPVSEKCTIRSFFAEKVR